MQLRNLLGARDDVDIVRMLVREPGCGLAEPPAVTQTCDLDL